MKKTFPYIILCMLFVTVAFGRHNLHATATSIPKIAILDTVAYLEHPDLQGCIVGGYNFVSNQPIDTAELPTYFHGTHITGIIAGNGEVQGVYPGAHILYYVVDAPNNTAYQQNVAKAIYRAIQDGANVINFSGKLACDLSDTAITQAIAYATQNDIIFVKSAGNLGPDLWSVRDLATSSDVLSIGAYDTTTGTLYPLSSRGPAFGTSRIKPDLIAPGVNILSTAPEADGNYLSASGTSMAAAYVSGALAYIASHRPDLTGYQLICAAANNARPLVDEWGNDYGVLSQGAGAISIDAAITTDILCMPHQLSFSVPYNTTPPTSLSTTLSVVNTTDEVVQYDLFFYTEETTLYFDIDIPSTLTLQPYETNTIPITVHVHEAIPPGHYTGRIYLTSATSTKNIPLLLEVPSSDYPIMRGFSLSDQLVSFSKNTDFYFLLESSMPLSLSVTANAMTSDMHYPLLTAIPLVTGLNEVGWDGTSTLNEQLPDGLYEITAEASSYDLLASADDLMLLIDNTPPLFREIIIKNTKHTYAITLVLEDLMLTYDYILPLIYQNLGSELDAITLAYSFNGIDYLALELDPMVDSVSFNLPYDTEVLYLRAVDFCGNITHKTIFLSDLP